MTTSTFRSDMTVELIRASGSDLDVVYAARVSTQGEKSKSDAERPEGEGLTDKDRGLINFLMKGRHGTPFEHNSFTFFVSAPIFVFREFQRHRIGISYNEESGRYRQLEPVFYLPDEKRNLVQEGKPGHYEFVPGTSRQYETTRDGIVETSLVAYSHYESMIDAGVAREVARSVLPVNIYSSMYVTMNARSIMSFLSLRTKREGSAFPSYPQREIEMVADQIEAIWKQHMPETHLAFQENGRVSP